MHLLVLNIQVFQKIIFLLCFGRRQLWLVLWRW